MTLPGMPATPPEERCGAFGTTTGRQCTLEADHAGACVLEGEPTDDEIVVLNVVGTIAAAAYHRGLGDGERCTIDYPKPDEILTALRAAEPLVPRSRLEAVERELADARKDAEEGRRIIGELTARNVRTDRERGDNMLHMAYAVSQQALLYAGLPALNASFEEVRRQYLAWVQADREKDPAYQFAKMLADAERLRRSKEVPHAD